MDSILKKKFVVGGMAAFLTIGVLAGCGGAEEEEMDDSTEVEETETEDAEMEEETE